MRCRVIANFAFDVDVPVEEDAAGWQAEGKGPRLDEQRQMWEKDLPQLLSFVAGAKDVQLQLQITESLSGEISARERELRRQMTTRKMQYQLPRNPELEADLPPQSEDLRT